MNALLGKVSQLGDPGWMASADTSGPVMLTEMYESTPRAFTDVMIYPSSAFYPLKDNHVSWHGFFFLQLCKPQAPIFATLTPIWTGQTHTG